jgi:hypothetical protein
MTTNQLEAVRKTLAVQGLCVLTMDDAKMIRDHLRDTAAYASPREYAATKPCIAKLAAAGVR